MNDFCLQFFYKHFVLVVIGRHARLLKSKHLFTFSKHHFSERELKELLEYMLSRCTFIQFI